MKKIVIILLLLIPMLAQAQVRVTLKSLINTQWQDTMYLPDNDNVLMFTQKEMTYYSYSICSTINIDSYYLSDKPDKKFDKSKVGKVQAGKYIILESEGNKRPDYYIIQKHTPTELKLQYVSKNAKRKFIKTYVYLWKEPELRHKTKPTDKPKTLIEEPDDRIYDVVENMPVFHSDSGSLRDYLNEKIKIPVEYSNEDFLGRVIITCVVEKDGSLSNFKVARSLDPLLDQEALRVVKNMPRWQPGTHNGKEVRVTVIIPVTFKAY